MFRAMMTTLALTALVACSACNDVTGPVTSDVTTQDLVRMDRQIPPGEPDNDRGGSEATPADQPDGSRRTRDAQISNKVVLGDPGGGGGVPDDVLCPEGDCTPRPVPIRRPSVSRD